MRAWPMYVHVQSCMCSRLQELSEGGASGWAWSQSEAPLLPAEPHIGRLNVTRSDMAYAALTGR